jgi:putative methyltransferase (TIGR04325 family)
MKSFLNILKTSIKSSIGNCLVISKQGSDRIKKSTNTPHLLNWSGNYSTWEDALQKCTSYDDDKIVEKCFNAMTKLKNGERVYERDSVLFDKIQHSFGLLVGLLRASLLSNDRKISIVDFGGSFGSSYFQNKELMFGFQINWCIVEQKKFVDLGIKHFQTDELKFYYSIEECIEKESPNVLVISGVIQYLKAPFELMEKFNKLNFNYIIIDRTSFIEHSSNLLTIQNVPPEIYDASYPAWFFTESNFLSYFNNYDLILDFDNHVDPPGLVNNTHNAYWKGFILRKKQEII